MNLFTGKPGVDAGDEDGNVKLINGHLTYVANSTGDPDQYRAGIFYVGFGAKRKGINSEKLRALVQNGIHFFTGDPYFRMLDRPTTSYWYNGYSSGTTLW